MILYDYLVCEADRIFYKNCLQLFGYQAAESGQMMNFNSTAEFQLSRGLQITR